MYSKWETPTPPPPRLILNWEGEDADSWLEVQVIVLMGGNIYGIFGRDSRDWRRMRQCMRWLQPGQCVGRIEGDFSFFLFFISLFLLIHHLSLEWTTTTVSTTTSHLDARPSATKQPPRYPDMSSHIDASHYPIDVSCNYGNGGGSSRAWDATCLEPWY